MRVEGRIAFLRGGDIRAAANWRKTITKFAFVLAATALTATAVFAEDAAAPVVADADGNGTFSLAEVQATYASVTEEAFKAADTDASGELSPEELKAAVDSGAFKA
ncbi:EF-hand domain-containing protein [Tabrizicola thermarum]|uniref:EF-hand domain-containing protein n=1 Tax=Tabrizicola thermarum TaxID=2670345 RepID=UPI001EE42E1B|nr:EF-hand domain-containing protein [Tabrizicola thermarum]